MRQSSTAYSTAKRALIVAAALAAVGCASVVPAPSATDSAEASQPPTAATSVTPTVVPAVSPSSSADATASIIPAPSTVPRGMIQSPIPSLSGQYVGVLGWFSGCITLASTSNLYEIYLPAGYRVTHPSGADFVIVDTYGSTVAKEGDSVGIEAEPLIGGGSSCQLGHKLIVTHILGVQPDMPTPPIDGGAAIGPNWPPFDNCADARLTVPG